MLGRLRGVEEIRTTVSAQKAVVAYDPERIGPEAIREAIRGLGMTVTDTRAPLARQRCSLADLLGWAFVSIVAVGALAGIVGERLGVVEALVETPPRL